MRKHIKNIFTVILLSSITLGFAQRTQNDTINTGVIDVVNWNYRFSTTRIEKQLSGDNKAPRCGATSAFGITKAGMMKILTSSKEKMGFCHATDNK